MGSVFRGWSVACVFFAALAASSAGAEDWIKGTDKNWTVISLQKSCSAVNRPLLESQQSPYNSLVLNASKARGLQLQVVFWPGYVETETADLQLATRRKQLTLSGETHGQPGVTVPFDAAGELREMLENSEELNVGIKSLPIALTFDIEPVRRLLKQLESCAAGL